MKTSVITVVSGRHEHLRGQLRGLAQSMLEPDQHIIVAIDDDEIARVVADTESTAQVVDVAAPRGRLPIGQARNEGARVASNGGADLLVFLDVDCIPSPELLTRYHDCATQPEHRTSLLCGPVTYLPARTSAWAVEELHAHKDPHPARPNPAAGVIETGQNYDLFWSLSFALSTDTWNRIGGFHVEYLGYGGEDTDFAAVARSTGVGLRWVGGAHAYHQHHHVSSPPIEHLDDIVRNAALFHRRWGRWPMAGWLDEFERAGRIVRSPNGSIGRIA
ncbi:glycosyltransferase family 2 protein [Rhodococcus sp. 1168]|uniref:glycosyltransferase family 2 protein n=1 Tax=Rhodococcus sp. 1168 TaxID=2018041 RepID=UPI000A0DAA60|nr:galactosyltransferase-related protein [Rhodococcus sp. 1168]ORI16543.1 sugar transferase [Rhodococcus sp. 1168]